MKKYIIFLFIASVIATGCDPNKDIYEELDLKYDVPYHETGLKYTFNAEDYSSAAKAAKAVALDENDTTWAKSIETYLSFNTKYTANEFVPAILSNNFPALKNGSNMFVTYNQYIGEMYGDITSDELTDDDYIAFGGTIASNLCFSDISELSNLSDYLSGKYPDAVADTYAEVFYRFPDVNITAGSFYKYDGSDWITIENSKVLVAEDYNSMGEASGQPGKYDNFSEDAMPGNYLPQFLSFEYPYAQAGLEKIVVCDMYGYESPIYAITCMFNGTDWEIYFPGIKKTSQFIRTDEKWVFDPTINYAMQGEDFMGIVNYVLGIYPDLVSSYGDSEYYFGASDYKDNFDIRITKRRSTDPDTYADLSDEDALALIWERVKEGIVVFLNNKFPDAVPSVEGFDVHYFITFWTFEDGYVDRQWTIEYKCSAAGLPPTFELVTDAIEITN